MVQGHSRLCLLFTISYHQRGHADWSEQEAATITIIAPADHLFGYVHVDHRQICQSRTCGGDFWEFLLYCRTGVSRNLCVRRIRNHLIATLFGRVSEEIHLWCRPIVAYGVNINCVQTIFDTLWGAAFIILCGLADVGRLHYLVPVAWPGLAVEHQLRVRKIR